MRWETLYNYVVGLAVGLLLFAWATASPEPPSTYIRAVFHCRAGHTMRTCAKGVSD
jgi:hypothetical protein